MHAFRLVNNKNMDLLAFHTVVLSSVGAFYPVLETKREDVEEIAD
jgi:hypothetical protein